MTAALMILPGLLCDSSMFSRQGSAFAGSQVIDGFGTIDRLDQMAERVLAMAPARMALLGHSMGARVALEVLRRAPDRVERLALVSTGVHAVRPGEAEGRYRLRDLGRSSGALALVAAWLPPMVAPQNRTPAILEPLTAMCVRTGVDAFAAQTEALLNRPEVESLLPSIRCPTLVAVGEGDVWSTPEQHRAFASRIPNAVLRVIPRAGHMLPIEAPEALNAAIITWLRVPTS